MSGQDQYSQREVVDLAIKFKDEVKLLAEDYSNAIAQLDNAVKKVEASEKKWWVVYKTHLTVLSTLIVTVVMIVAIAGTMTSNNLCGVNVGENGKAFSIQSCRQPHN